MKNGDIARLVQPTIDGVIKDTRWSNQRDCKEHLLEWTDPSTKEVHQRWFFETELAQVGVANAN